MASGHETAQTVSKLQRSVAVMRAIIEKATGHDFSHTEIEKLVRDHWVELQTAAHSIHDAITFENGRERGRIDQQVADACEEIARKEERRATRIRRCAPDAP